MNEAVPRLKAGQTGIACWIEFAESASFTPPACLEFTGIKTGKKDQKTAENPKHAALFRNYGKKKVSREELEEAIKNVPGLTLDADELRQTAWTRKD